MGASKSKMPPTDVTIDMKDYGQDFDELDTILGQAVMDGKVIKFIVPSGSDTNRHFAEEVMRESGTCFEWINDDTMVVNKKKDSVYSGLHSNS